MDRQRSFNLQFKGAIPIQQNLLHWNFGADVMSQAVVQKVREQKNGKNKTRRNDEELTIREETEGALYTWIGTGSLQQFSTHRRPHLPNGW